MNHPQYRQLDSIRFSTSTLKNLNREMVPYIDGLTIGKVGEKGQVQLSSRFFIPPNITRGSDKEVYLGVSLGASMSGMNLNIHSGIEKDVADLISSYGPVKFCDLNAAREVPDLKLLKMSDLIWIEIGDPESNSISGDRRSPSLPPEVETGKDLIHFIALLKEVTNQPVVVSMRGIDVKSDIDNVLVTGADGIHISCGYDRDGAEGPSYHGLASEPVTTVVEALSHMEIFKSKEKGMKLLLTGPFRNASDILKMRALGVDGFGLDHLIMDDIINTGSKENIRLDWATIGESLGISIRDLKDDITKELGSLNVADMSSMDRSMLMVDNYHSAALTGLPLAGYGKEIPFWRH